MTSVNFQLLCHLRRILFPKMVYSLLVPTHSMSFRKTRIKWSVSVHKKYKRNSLSETWVISR